MIGFDDIKEHFDLTVSPTNGIGEMLLRELDAQEEVGAVIATEDCFEISEYLQMRRKCVCVRKASDRFSLMGCNLEDVHLLDADEEHEVATIAELNRNTLTDEASETGRMCLPQRSSVSMTVRMGHRSKYRDARHTVSGISPSRLPGTAVRNSGRDGSMNDREYRTLTMGGQA